MSEEVKKLFREQRVKGMVEILRSFGIKAQTTEDDSVIEIELNATRFAKLRLMSDDKFWKIIIGPETGITMEEEFVPEYAKNRKKPGLYIEDPKDVTLYVTPDDYAVTFIEMNDMTYATSEDVNATRFDRAVIYDDGYVELEMCGRVVKQMWVCKRYSCKPFRHAPIDYELSSYFRKWIGES